MATIVIVDDSKLARIVAARAVGALAPDWDRVEASNAEEALAIVADRSIDAALLDFNMPGRNGLELATELRASHPTMPIALITANLQEEVVQGAVMIDATFVGKPVTEEALRGFIARAAAHLATGSA